MDRIKATISSIHPVAALTSLAVGVLTINYRRAIQRRIKQVEEESWVFGMGVTMVRTPAREKEREEPRDRLASSSVFSNLRLLELSPSFQKKYGDTWSLLSLGEYMASLHPAPLPEIIPKHEIPRMIQREIESGMAVALLKALGPNIGRALLPTVGYLNGPAQTMAAGLAGRWFASQDGGGSVGRSSENDRGGLQVSLMSLLALSDANAKVRGGGPTTTSSSSPSTDGSADGENEDKTTSPAAPAESSSAMDKMRLGEVGYTPSFSDPQTDLLPNPFVLFRDFPAAIQKMEDLLQGDQDQDDDDDRYIPDPASDIRASVIRASDIRASVIGRGSRVGGQTTRELDAAQESLWEDNELLQQDLKEKETQMKNPLPSTIPEEKEDSGYDPHGTKMADPVPVNPRLFPGLHLGWGSNVQCTHTNREVLQNRLISVLLNKLGANYHSLQEGGEAADSLFRVQLENEKLITTPSELVQALLDSGHDVQAVPACQITTFGMSLCVLEDDSSWSHIPLAVFLESGYEDDEGRTASAFVPHSGLNMEITGPLFGEHQRLDGKSSKCSIQNYIAIDGYCGWQSNHNGDVPWLQPVECGSPPVEGQDAVRATRIAALHANVLNGIATDLGLPFGGYGLTAVCNDSAAVIEQCLYGTSSIYPMTSIGRFLQLTLRYTKNFRNKLLDLPDNNMEQEVDDLGALIKAMRQIPSDVNASPSIAANAAKRMLHCLPRDRPFVMMDDTKRVMEWILQEEEAEDIDESPDGPTK